MIERQGDILALSGPMTLDVAHALHDQVDELPASASVIVDLAKVTAVDSSAIAVLFYWLRAARARGATLTVRNLPPSLKSLADLYGVDDFLPLSN